MIDIDRLEILAKEATQGEWQCGEGDAAGVNIFGDAHWIATVHQNGDEREWDYISSKQMMKNATFIAAANPATVLELIKEVRKVRRKISPCENCETPCEYEGESDDSCLLEQVANSDKW